MTAKGASSSCIRRLKWSSNWFSVAKHNQVNTKYIQNTAYHKREKRVAQFAVINLTMFHLPTQQQLPATFNPLLSQMRPWTIFARRIVFMSSSPILNFRPKMKYILSAAACIYVIYHMQIYSTTWTETAHHRRAREKKHQEDLPRYYNLLISWSLFIPLFDPNAQTAPHWSWVPQQVRWFDDATGVSHLISHWWGVCGW